MLHDYMITRDNMGVEYRSCLKIGGALLNQKIISIGKLNSF